MTTRKIFNDITELAEFKKDFKKLSKKYQSLSSDFETFKNTPLKAFHKLNIDNTGIIRIANLEIESPHIYKVKKFACKALKGTGAKSGIRIIYAYYPDKDTVEFVEIYYKGDKSNEDKKRLKSYYG